MKEEQLAQIEAWFANILPAPEALPSFVKPLQKNMTVESLKIAQNYTGFDYTHFSNLSQAFDTEENTEDLLAML
ncbi:MAG: hypothetical protein MUE81_23265 [Thermoflexibacter sp.]|nr:hypothetical protein [Thermoflexibacter sp.]